MKFFVDGIPYGDVPAPKPRPGEFFPRVVGLRVSHAGNRRSAFPGGEDGTTVGNWLNIEPLYIPIVRVTKRAGQIFIEINSTRPLVYITLQARRPWVNIFRFPWEEADQ